MNPDDSDEKRSAEPSVSKPGATFKPVEDSENVKVHDQPQGIRSRWDGQGQLSVKEKPVEKKSSGKTHRTIFFATLIVVAPVLAVVSAVLSDKKFSHCLQDPKQAAMLSRSIGRLCKTNNWNALASIMFMQAYKLNPDDIQAWVDDALLKQNSGDDEGARLEYMAINKVTPSARSYNNLGCIYQNYHQLDKAIECFTEALRLDPHWAFAWNNRGNCYVTQAKYELAVNDFNQGIKNSYATSYFGRERAYARMGRSEMAARDRAIIDKHHYINEVFGFMRTPPAPDEL